ncbi:MAG TPA: hypothetical protein VHA13_04295 [Gammaproteobacteria bacterium]|nr:hypothetical protein [Gammaproteobacteria bacterium]
MLFVDKSLLIVKPAEPFRQWLMNVLQASHVVPKTDISLEQIQDDANCYVIPMLPSPQTAAYIKQHSEEIFRTELSTWCKVKEVWPDLSFANFLASFNFNFYFDWMDFSSTNKLQGNSLPNITLLIKPNENFADYLKTLMVERFKMDPAIVDKKMNFELIQNGSTAVITDVNSLNDVEYFIDQHCEEIFIHQLILWGGADCKNLWPRDMDLRGFKESFSIEIHQHTYVMAH